MTKYDDGIRAAEEQDGEYARQRMIDQSPENERTKTEYRRTSDLLSTDEICDIQNTLIRSEILDWEPYANRKYGLKTDEDMTQVFVEDYVIIITPPISSPMTIIDSPTNNILTDDVIAWMKAKILDKELSKPYGK